MPIVEYSLEDGKELIPEEEEAARIRIREAASRSYVYDPDCPPLTEKQLSEFTPVNFNSMEERAKAMESAGLINIECRQVIKESVTA